MSEKKEPNYRGLVAVGIAFMGAGVALTASTGVGVGTGLVGLGVVFTIIGAKNRDKWKK
jgi:hypothetical protein